MILKSIATLVKHLSLSTYRHSCSYGFRTSHISSNDIFDEKYVIQGGDFHSRTRIRIVWISIIVNEL
jgi:hypothetical protein